MLAGEYVDAAGSPMVNVRDIHPLISIRYKGSRQIKSIVLLRIDLIQSHKISSDFLLTNPNGCLDAGAREHCDERVYAEDVDLAAHEIADARLSNAESFGGLLLRQAGALNVFG